MKKHIVVVMVVVFALVLSAVAFASNNVEEFAGGAMGKVMFDGKAHNAKLGGGCKSTECHPKLFPMKKAGTEGAAKITMADINAGKFCGACHNGTKAFSAKEAANCTKCHKK